MFSKDQKIGDYQLVRRLGRGGFGEVWLALKRSQLVTKKVALKLTGEENINLETIRKEVHLWERACGHPNVLNLIDADIYDGQVYIVSEYAKDGSLHDKLKAEGKFPVRKAIQMTIGILKGLEFLHTRKIIHRDIKPQNILLQGEFPRLADFGISRTLQTGSFYSTQIVGTPSYMSPESFEGKRNEQTDIWSVGVVLYQLVNGSLPFSQESPSERMYAIMNKDFAPFPEEIPPALKQVIKKSLEKSPQNRYQTAKQMRDDLVRILWSEKQAERTITEIEIKPPPKIAPLPPPLLPQIESPTNVPTFAQIEPSPRFYKIRNGAIIASILLLLGIAAFPFLPSFSDNSQAKTASANVNGNKNSNANSEAKLKNKR